MTASETLTLFAVGTAASIFGSLVGLGGGFVVVPVLRIAFGVAPATAAATSLVMVFANTASATVGYLRDRRVDLRIALPFTAGAVPGGIAGAFAVRGASPQAFDVAYGILMVVLAILVLRRRALTSRAEHERTFAHDPRFGILAGLPLGFFSSFFGIGGGVISIPVLLIGARMAPHIVTATTAFVVTTTSPIGIATHALRGDVDWAAAVPLALGGLVGGAIGPRIARRVSSPLLITLVAYAFILAAIGLVIRHLR